MGRAGQGDDRASDWQRWGWGGLGFWTRWRAMVGRRLRVESSGVGWLAFGRSSERASGLWVGRA